MKGPVVTALLMLVFGVAYVWHGVAFREGERPRPAVVRTWGELLAQPAHPLPTGETVRFGLDRRAVPQQGAALLYALFERPAGVTARTAVTVARSDEDSRSWNAFAAPAGGGARSVLKAVTLHVADRDVTLELRDPQGLVLETVDLRATNDVSPWRPFEVGGETHRDGGLRLVDARPQHGMPAAPVCMQIVLRAYEPGAPPSHDERLTPLIPRAGGAWVTLRPTEEGCELRIGEGTHAGIVAGLLARFEVNGVPAAPPPVDTFTRPTVADLRVAWNFDAIGAVPGDRVTVEVLWCHEGWWGSGLGRVKTVARGIPPTRRSNPITITVGEPR